jgi:ABC-type antimicrobial peptide transport system permease subunit
LDNAGTYVFLLILLIVVAFGVLNTILMSVMERTREFGMMKALGTKPWQIIQLILTEAFILTIIGILIGTLIGSGVSLYFATHPIVFSEYEMSFREFGFEPEMYTKLTFKSIFCSGPIVLFISMISCFYPAIRASRFKPAQALK